MKTVLRFFACACAFAALPLVIGCGSFPTAEDSSASTIELHVAAKALDSTAEYTITVTGPGMNQIGPYAYAGGQTVELKVPRGDSRRFRFERRINHELTDTGSTVKDIRNAIEYVTVTLVSLGSPPVITHSPASVTVSPGVRARFTVDASGSALRYRWYRDGNLIAGETGNSYELSSPQQSDSGSYFICEVYNAFGSVFSDTAWLRVVTQAVQPVILYGPDDDTVAVGDTAVFRVSAAGIGLTFTWYRDGTVIAGQTDSVLKVPGVTHADSGAKFMCIVGNAAGNDSTREAILHVVAGAPRLLWQSMDKPSSPGEYICDAVSTPDQLVIVGRYGLIYTSPKSFPPTWTRRSSGVSVDLNGVCWAGAKLVAVGREGNIVTSDDGITWTSQTSGTGNYLNAVAGNGSSYMAVGNGGTILTSPDAVIWTARTYPGQHHYDEFHGVTWISDRWYVIGVNRIMTTLDGDTWTDYSTPFRESGVYNGSGSTNYHFKRITWSGTRYVLSYYATYARANTFYSDNLSDWFETVPAGLDGAGVSTMVWTGDAFVSANWSTSTVSPDGISWTSYPMPDNGTHSYESLIFTGTHLLAVGTGNIAWAQWPPQ